MLGRRKTSPSPRSKAFTLIELLVVVTIMAILTGLATVAFLDLGKAGRLGDAGNQTVNLTHLARQNSLSQNALTAVILVTDTSFPDRYRLFTLLQLQPPVSGTAPASSDWKQIISWKTLANGVIIDPSDIPNNALQDYSPTALTPPFPTLRFRGSTISQYKYMIFQSDGSLYGNSAANNSAVLKLVEGFFPQATSNTPVYTRASSGTVSNYYRITVIASTGQTKIDRP